MSRIHQFCLLLSLAAGCDNQVPGDGSPIAVAAVADTGVPLPSAPETDPLEEIRAEVDALRAEVAALEQQVEANDAARVADGLSWQGQIDTLVIVDADHQSTLIALAEAQGEHASALVTLASFDTEASSDLSILRGQIIVQTSDLNGMGLSLDSHADRLDGISADVGDLASDISDVREPVEALTRYVDIDTVRSRIVFHDANVYVQSGAGATGARENGLGNLIIGYNEQSHSGDPAWGNAAEFRAGSHNLVIGADLGYSGHGGIVTGESNQVDGDYAVVIGGSGNIAVDDHAMVLGGDENIAYGQYSAVVGGAENVAYGSHATVLGGSENQASSEHSLVAGGSDNYIQASRYLPGGYTSNNAHAVILGGNQNEVQMSDAVLVGGSCDVLSYLDWRMGENETCSLSPSGRWDTP